MDGMDGSANMGADFASPCRPKPVQAVHLESSNQICAHSPFSILMFPQIFPFTSTCFQKLSTMPRQSKKRVLEDTLWQVWQLRMLLKATRSTQDDWIVSSSTTSEDATDIALLVLYDAVSRSRYITRCSYRTRLSTNVFQIDLQSHDTETSHRPFLSDSEFLHKYRMSRDKFSHLLSLIIAHPVFDARNKGPKQAPPAYQLMVFLKYIGTDGSGNSNPDLRNTFRTGRGTNELFKSRVIKAISSLKGIYYTWPTEQERDIISSRIHNDFDFPNCVGFADGTLNPLSSKPQREDSADYYGRKHGYSLSTLIVCDDRRLIRYYLAGWPGSCHDNRIHRNSGLVTSVETFFTESQYVLGDSAFEASDSMIPAFKKPNGCTLPRECEVFNAALSSARVISEHTIGIWKARFPWLRNIRMTLTEDARSMKQILKVIQCTVILHNFLRMENENDIPPEWLDQGDVNLLDPRDELNRGNRDNEPKNKRQKDLMTYINNKRF
jgi:hypothetical protein